MIIETLMLLAGVFEFRDAFNYADGADGAPAWFTESVWWEARGNELAFLGGERSFAIVDQAPYGQAVVVEATVTVRERRSGDWCMAGMAVRRDAGNYWHLALGEAPETEGRRHFIELTEMLDGKWLAQHDAETRLTNIAGNGNSFNWQYNQSYRLRIAMTQERIDGYVRELDGAEVAHLSFRFDNRAVTSGQPALNASGFVVSYDEVLASVDSPVQGPTPEPAPEYTFEGYSGITAKATGFFYPKEIKGRWWLIDPRGRAFYVKGTDHVRYDGHWCQKLGYSPYGRNASAKYGDEEKWAQATVERLKDWGFNALTAGHSNSLRYRGIPHIEFLTMGASFARVEDICPQTWWTGFPNVFSPKWPRHCDKLARQLCMPHREDPWLIGYFIDNELEWYGKDWRDWGLFNETWKKPPEHSAKQAWIEFLSAEIGAPTAFAEHWGVTVADWDALAHHRTPTAPLTDRARQITRKWVRLIAERYFEECARAIRRFDPNHLVLGSRFAGQAPDIWDIAGRHCDVVSFNMYPRIDVERGVPENVIKQIREWGRAAGKPLMITEWSFPALDTGLPSVHGAGMRVDTQAQRAQCFTYFQTLMFSLSFMVGSDYFMYLDEPALGISESFPEDSNYGLVNEKDEPYPAITRAAEQVNSQVYALHLAERVRTAPETKLVRWLSRTPRKTRDIIDVPVTFSAGDLSLRGPTGSRPWQVYLGESLLGEWRPLLHQQGPQDIWVDADSARVQGIRESKQVTVIDLELSRTSSREAITRVDDKTGATDPQRSAPFAYRGQWRFWVPKQGEWFASQCLWIENTDKAPWRLGEIFHYLCPDIGSDHANDEVLGAGVPNYYMRGAAWMDAKAGFGIGCWYAKDADFECSYWKDPNGGFHPDLRHKADVLLEPGGRFDQVGPLAFFFPLRDPSLGGFAEQVKRLKCEVLSPTTHSRP